MYYYSIGPVDFERFSDVITATERYKRRVVKITRVACIFVDNIDFIRVFRVRNKKIKLKKKHTSTSGVCPRVHRQSPRLVTHAHNDRTH